MVQLSGMPSGTQIACPNCQQPYAFQVEQILDVQHDPTAKARLLSGRLNVAVCPHCGYPARLSAPMVYHDLGKELLIQFMPMELGLPKTEQDRVLGAMVQAVVNAIPREQRKGYLFVPKTALTMQGLLEMVLEADGITKEMIEERRNKLRLVETFLQTDPDNWEKLVKEYDARLDEDFFEMVTASAETALASGRRDVAEQILAVRDKLLNMTTVGKQILQSASQQEAVIQEVAAKLNALGPQASIEQLADLSLEVGSMGDAALQVLVGLARPVMDESFFNYLTEQANAVSGDKQAYINDVQARLTELTTMIDQANQEMLEQSAQLVDYFLSSEDMEAAIRSRVTEIDEPFLRILQANIQHAEHQRDTEATTQLRHLLDTIMAVIQESSPPVLRLMNELLSTEDEAEAVRQMEARAGQFGPQLLQWLDMLMQEMSQSGAEQEVVDRLQILRQAAEHTLSEHGDPHNAAMDASNLFAAQAKQASTQPSKPVVEENEKPSNIILPFSARKRKRDN